MDRIEKLLDEVAGSDVMAASDRHEFFNHLIKYVVQPRYTEIVEAVRNLRVIQQQGS
jgi:hypothetical protein